MRCAGATTISLEAAKDAVMKWKYVPAEHETIEDVEVEFH